MVPEGFPLPRRWTVINRNVSMHPTLFDEEWADVGKLESVPEPLHIVDYLTPRSGFEMPIYQSVSTEKCLEPYRLTVELITFIFSDRYGWGSERRDDCCSCRPGSAEGGDRCASPGSEAQTGWGLRVF